MIIFIEGILIENNYVQAVLNVQGVGYEVHIPVTTAEALPPLGSKICLHTFALYRQDTQNLYGFKEKEDREFFKLLIEKVSGIGPKIALSIMSKLSVEELKEAIYHSNVSLLAQCPGIGKKTAERLTLELKDRIKASILNKKTDSSSPLPSQPNNPNKNIQTDAIAALISLGYKALQAEQTVVNAIKKYFSQTEPTVEELIKKALS